MCIRADADATGIAGGTGAVECVAGVSSYSVENVCKWHKSYMSETTCKVSF